MASCTCKYSTMEDSVPYAHRPSTIVTVKPTNTKLTEIEKIITLKHPRSHHFSKPCDLPQGEGQFLIKWKECEQQDWIDTDHVFEHGISAIRDFFGRLNASRKIEELRQLEKLTNISSLDDITCHSIVESTETDYKLKIGGLTNDFLYELNHPQWKKNITQQFEIVRENGNSYVWANHVQVELWNAKERTLPSAEEIEKMDWFDYGRYLIRKDEGYYTENNEESNSSASEESNETIFDFLYELNH